MEQARSLHNPPMIAPFAETFSSSAISNRLDGLLRDSIDEVLGDLVGRQVRQAVFNYLQSACSLDEAHISEHLPKFFELLEEILGKASKTIGEAIARSLFEKLGWEFQENQAFEFFDYLEAAKVRIRRELIERV